MKNRLCSFLVSYLTFEDVFCWRWFGHLTDTLLWCHFIVPVRVQWAGTKSGALVYNCDQDNMTFDFNSLCDPELKKKKEEADHLTAIWTLLQKGKEWSLHQVPEFCTVYWPGTDVFRNNSQLPLISPSANLSTISENTLSLHAIWMHLPSSTSLFQWQTTSEGEGA